MSPQEQRRQLPDPSERWEAREPSKPMREAGKSLRNMGETFAATIAALLAALAIWDRLYVTTAVYNQGMAAVTAMHKDDVQRIEIEIAGIQAPRDHTDTVVGRRR